jgi:hypothetical protein
MPYVSEQQRKLFNAKAASGEMDQTMVDHWNEESKGLKLPKKVHHRKEHHEKKAGFVGNFLKTASATGWSELEGLLSEMRKPSYLSVGDRVAYYDRIRWTTEPDGKHAKGLYADFEHEGLPIGSRGSVVAIVDPYSSKDPGSENKLARPPLADGQSHNIVKVLWDKNGRTWEYGNGGQDCLRKIEGSKRQGEINTEQAFGAREFIKKLIASKKEAAGVSATV